MIECHFVLRVLILIHDIFILLVKTGYENYRYGRGNGRELEWMYGDGTGMGIK